MKVNVSERQKIPTVYTLPLYFILFALMLFGGRTLIEAQENPLSLSRLNRFVGIILALVIILFYFLKKGRIKKNIPIPIILYGIFVFLAFLSSLMFSDWVWYSLWKTFEIFTVFLWSVFLWDLSSKYKDLPIQSYEVILKFLKFLLLTVIAGAFIFPNLAFLYNSKALLPYQLRGILITINPNSLGLMSSLVLFVSLKRKKILWCIISGVIFILAQSRTSFLGFVAAVIFIVLANRKSSPWVRIAFLVLFIGVIVIQSEFIWTFLLRGQSPEMFRNLSGRLIVWHMTLEKFKSGAFVNKLLGFGYLMASIEVFSKYANAPALASLHSDYMDALISVGILGTFFLIFVILIAFFKAIKISIENSKYLGYVGCLLLIFFRTFTGNVVSNFGFFLVLFFSVIIVLYKQER